MQKTLKAVRSFRVARLLMERGHIPVGTERSRKSQGFIVYLFDDTKEFATDFEDIMREIAQEK